MFLVACRPTKNSRNSWLQSTVTTFFTAEDAEIAEDVIGLMPTYKESA